MGSTIDVQPCRANAVPAILAAAGFRGMRGAGTVTLLFTDLVGSSELLGTLGDQAAEPVRRRHFASLRDAITVCHGREIKTLGDGVMAVFDSAIDAVACGGDPGRMRIQRARSARGPGRCAHGRADPRRNDYFGTPVVVAQRLCDAAEGGQILTSELVRARVAPRHRLIRRSGAGAEGRRRSRSTCARSTGARRRPPPESRTPTAPPRVLIADDHPVFRDGLAALLEPVPHRRRRAGDKRARGGRHGARPRRRRRRDGPADARAERHRGDARAGRRASRLGVLVLTMFEDDDSVFAAMRAGARGYILKGAEQAKIVQAIEVVGCGEAIFGPGIAQRMIAMFAGAERAPEPFPTSLTASARSSSCSRRASPTRRSPSGWSEPEDGPQPRLEHLQQAPGGRPRAGDRPRTRGGLGRGQQHRRT